MWIGPDVVAPAAVLAVTIAIASLLDVALSEGVLDALRANDALLDALGTP